MECLGSAFCACARVDMGAGARRRIIRSPGGQRTRTRPASAAPASGGTVLRYGRSSGPSCRSGRLMCSFLPSTPTARKCAPRCIRASSRSPGTITGSKNLSTGAQRSSRTWPIFLLQPGMMLPALSKACPAACGQPRRIAPVACACAMMSAPSPDFITHQSAGFSALCPDIS